MKRIINPNLVKDIVTPDQIRAKETLDIQEARYTHKPLDIIITRAEEDQGTGADILGIFAVGHYGESNIKFKIPAESFIPDIPEKPIPRFHGSRDMQTPYQYSKRYIDRHMGGTYRIMVEDILMDNGEISCVYGSRITAMEQDMKRGFFPKRASDAITADVITQARIVEVHRRTLVVEISGVEAPILWDQVAWTIQPDLRQIYKVGQPIEVAVTDLQTNNGKIESITLSKKLTEEDPRIQNIREYSNGDAVTGVVVHTIPSGVIVSLENGKMSCLCSFSQNFSRPEIGQDVIVVIDNIDGEKLRMYGHVKTKIGLVR